MSAETIPAEGLLPCPFCGGKDPFIQTDEELSCVICGDCGCALGEAYDRSAWPDHKFVSRDEATSAWNTRSTRPAEPAPGVEVGDGLPAVLDQFERAAMACERLGKLTRDDEKTRRMRKGIIADLATARKALVAFVASTLEAERAKTAAAKAKIDELRRERDEADNALVDLYRDPKTGSFKFPTDVAAIVRRLDAAEASLSRALQDRDEAVRVAVEDERDRLLQEALDCGNYEALGMLHSQGAMFPADRASIRLGGQNAS